MATYTLSPNVKRQFLDNSGNPLSAGKLYTVEAGGSYPADAVTVYQTSSGTAHTNPIILDSAGRISGSSEIYLEPGQSYKFILTTSADVSVWTQDNIAAVPGSAAALDISPLTLAVNVDAGDLIYNSDGSGSVTAGTWAKADADNTYSSTTPELAFAVTSGSAGGTIEGRQGGVITLTGPLTPGAKYYVSATAGAITTTAPTVNARYVGQALTTTQLVINNEIADSPTDGVVIDPRIKTLCEGRLTLTTGVPVTTADVTAATTLYWTPYKGNNIALYSGSRWVLFNQAQLSIAVPAVATQVYDVFVDYNAGTPALALVAWTNDTTRATALTTQDGVYVLTGTLGRRYVGTVRTVTSGQLNDSFALRHVWNYYHRVPRPMRVVEATASWTYDAAAFHQANASTANQLDFVVGVEESEVQAQVSAVGDCSGGNVTFRVGIGLGSTSVNSATVFAGAGPITASDAEGVFAIYEGFPGIGRRTLVWLEAGDGGGSTFTWYSGGGSYANSGIVGRVWG